MATATTVFMTANVVADRWASNCRSTMNARHSPRAVPSHSNTTTWLAWNKNKRFRQKRFSLVDSFYKMAEERRKKLLGLTHSDYEANWFFEEQDEYNDQQVSDCASFDEDCTIETCSTIFSMSEPQLPMSRSILLGSEHKAGEYGEEKSHVLQEETDAMPRSVSALQVRSLQDGEEEYEPFWQLVFKAKEEKQDRKKPIKNVAKQSQRETLLPTVPQEILEPIQKRSLLEKTKAAFMHSTSTTLIDEGTPPRRRKLSRKNRGVSLTNGTLIDEGTPRTKRKLPRKNRSVSLTHQNTTAQMPMIKASVATATASRQRPGSSMRTSGARAA